MRYISEVDDRVFNTEQECLEHENAVRKSREELKRKEKLQMEHQNRLDEIHRKDEEIRKLVESYRKGYEESLDLYYRNLFVELLRRIL